LKAGSFPEFNFSKEEVLEIVLFISTLNEVSLHLMENVFKNSSDAYDKGEEFYDKDKKAHDKDKKAYLYLIGHYHELCNFGILNPNVSNIKELDEILSSN
jgi:hypothetical protein